MDEFAALLQSRLNDGASLEQALAELHASGAHPVAAIKAVHVVLGVSLGDAKAVVSACPSWQLQVRAANGLHEEIARLAAS